jgi:hypothetical protein
VGGRSSIAAGLRADPAQVAPVQEDRDTLPVPRMVLVVRAGRCIPLAPAPVALRALGEGLLLAPRGPALARAPGSARLGLAQVAQAV